MNVLVTGATGFIGGKLVTRLINEGHSVRVLVRNLNTSPFTENQVDIFEGDGAFAFLKDKEAQEKPSMPLIVLLLLKETEKSKRTSTNSTNRLIVRVEQLNPIHAAKERK